MKNILNKSMLFALLVSVSMMQAQKAEAPENSYDLGAKIAKTAYKEGRAVIDVALEHTDLSREELEKHLNFLKLTLGGIGK